MRRGGDGNVPLAGQHARGDVEPDPAGARKIDFGPGVQIGKIVLDLARSLDRIDVGAQLNEVARDETGGETEMAQDLDQQPRGVAARSRAGGQRLLRRLDARLHADDVADLVAAVCALRSTRKLTVLGASRGMLGEIFCKQRPGLDGRQIRREFGLEIVGIGERKTVGIGLDEEIERIDHGHLRREIDLDLQFGGLFREDKARQPVALRVLLPVHEMIGWRDLERIAQDRRAGMRRRAQPNGLRAEVDRTVVFVMRDVM